MFEPVIVAVWVMLPAYIPNNAAVLLGGGRRIDGGRTMGAKPLLGSGKTWRGTIAGVTAGIAVAVGLNASRDVIIGAYGTVVPLFPLAAILGLPIGAMLGDLVASFVKRRADVSRGSAVLGLDQLDFVVGALALTLLASPDWFIATFTLPVLVVVVLLTPVLHVLTNAVAYYLGLKNEPW